MLDRLTNRQMSLVVEQYGIVPYQQAYNRQLELVEMLHRDEEQADTCMLLEHPSVFTLGRNGSSSNVSVSSDFLEEKNIDLIRIERGGEVTYHGPGQLVCYPVVKLKRRGLTVADFISSLEEVMLEVADAFGVKASRDSRNHGIWLGNRKIGSVGIAIRHGITYHGLALNVNCDLEPFGWINPCGLSGVSMSSLHKEAGGPVDIDKAKNKMAAALGTVFNCSVMSVHSGSKGFVGEKASRGRSGKPKWLRQRLPSGAGYEKTRKLVASSGLHTVCQEARCPNQFECYGKGTATFMIMGESCTRNCRFCAVKHAAMELPDPEEPIRIARTVSELGLEYVVLTSVTRDDLADGGASHFAAAIREIRKVDNKTLVEVLIPDFQGNTSALKTVCLEKPAVLNHNVETVSRLYPEVRPQAVYNRSLQLLSDVKQIDPSIVTKSGLMVGLGESVDELKRTMVDIRDSGCDLLTIGQYLQPTSDHLPVKRFVTPEEFAQLKEIGLQLGFAGVASGPHVRSSYRANYLFARAAS